MPDTFLAIADTHLGASAGGYARQPRCLDRLDAVTAGVNDLVQREGIKWIVHAGDMTDAAQPGLMTQWAEQLAAPVAACLGNHDLTSPTAAAEWQSLAHPRLCLGNAVLRLESVDLVLFSHPWLTARGLGLYWDEQEPREAMGERDLAWLAAALDGPPQRDACLVVHAPPDPIPARLTGLDHDIHVPRPEYASALRSLLDAHPRVRLVVSGHTHVTCATRHGRRCRLMLSSLTEAPFEAFLVRFSAEGMAARAVSTLRDASAPYDRDAAWVNGAAEDRQIHGDQAFDPSSQPARRNSR